VVRPDGSTSRATYAGPGLPIALTAPDGARRTRTYDDRGNVLTSTEPGGAATAYRYDEKGRLTAVTDPLGGTIRIASDAAGLPVAVTGPAGGTDRYERDAFGRVVALTDPLGGTTLLGWTPEGLPAWSQGPDGARESWSYDADGNPEEYVGPTGAVTRTATAGFGLPAFRSSPDAGTVRYTYDTEMRLTAVTDAEGATWTYTYDAAGRPTAETDFNSRTVTYLHNAAGQLVERVNGAGQSVRYTRDDLGRVVAGSTAEATTTFRYDAADRLVHAANQDARLDCVRDESGRVVVETVNGRAVTSVYDLLGRRVRRTTPGGVTSGWEFDAADRPVALHVAGQTLAFSYDAAGREVGRTLGRFADVRRDWNDAHRLVAESWTTATGSGSRSWEYDQAGSVLRTASDLGGVNVERVFALDSAGRIRGVHDPGRPWAQENFAYGPRGSVLEVAAAPATARGGQGDPGRDDAVGTYSGTLLTRAGRTRYTYDGQGRVVGKVRLLLSGGRRIWAYTWDAHDRLVGLQTPDGTRWRYLYDPLGRRIAKLRLTADGEVAERTDFVWDGAKLAEESADGTGAVRTWEWQPGSARPLVQTDTVQSVPAHSAGSGEADEPSASAASQGEIDRRFYGIISDLVGTPTHLVDEDGRIAWHGDTTVWGRPRREDGAAAADCPLRFPGQYSDVESGLHYNYLRYYDPEVARYQSPDPLGLAPADDPHSYVANPLTWSDPMGLAACEIFYRVMSAKEFEGLGPMGDISVKGTENFVTQEVDYVTGIAAKFARRGGRNAQKYTHLVRYAMEPGTRDALIAAGRGSGDNIEAIREAYGLHLDEIGQSVDFVHVKLEREGLNFGLRPGSVDVFNSRIRSMTHTLL
jgi:RHS repeat-associated protein